MDLQYEFNLIKNKIEVVANNILEKDYEHAMWLLGCIHGACYQNMKELDKD